MMYCTGGVRCERASALLKDSLGEEAEARAGVLGRGWLGAQQAAVHFWGPGMASLGMSFVWSWYPIFGGKQGKNRNGCHTHWFCRERII